jgi:hypothetical protein
MVGNLHEFMKWSWSLWKLIFVCIICKFLTRLSENTYFSIKKTGHLRHCIRKRSLFIAKITQNTEILLHFSRQMQFWILLQVIRIVSLDFARKYLRQRFFTSPLTSASHLSREIFRFRWQKIWLHYRLETAQNTCLPAPPVWFAKIFFGVSFCI